MQLKYHEQIENFHQVVQVNYIVEFQFLKVSYIV